MGRSAEDGQPLLGGEGPTCPDGSTAVGKDADTDKDKDKGAEQQVTMDEAFNVVGTGMAQTRILIVCGQPTTHYKSKWRNIWLRFCSQHLGCRGSQPKHVSNPA